MKSLFFLTAIAGVLLLLRQTLVIATRRSAPSFSRLKTKLPIHQTRSRLHPAREFLAKRYPGLHTFSTARLNPRRFTGLPLTLMVVAALYVLFLIGGLAEEVLETPDVIRLDRKIDGWLDPFRETLTILVFIWITDLGGSNTLSLVSLVSTGFFWAHRRFHLIFPLWVSIIGALATTWLGKYAFARQRPAFVTEVEALAPSFPSAHATGAMAVYGFVAYAIIRELPRWRERFEVIYWSLALILLIGFSRIFLSVHYATDVAAGLLVGVFWLLVGFTTAELRRQRPETAPPGQRS